MALGFAPLGSTPLGASPSGLVGSTFTIAATATVLAFGQVVVPAAGEVSTQTAAAFVGQTVSSGAGVIPVSVDTAWDATVLVQSVATIHTATSVSWSYQVPAEILYYGVRVKMDTTDYNANPVIVEPA
jgi:hypothetical protein